MRAARSLTQRNTSQTGDAARQQYRKMWKFPRVAHLNQDLVRTIIMVLCSPQNVVFEKRCMRVFHVRVVCSVLYCVICLTVTVSSVLFTQTGEPKKRKKRK